MYFNVFYWCFTLRGAQYPPPLSQRARALRARALAAQLVVLRYCACIFSALAAQLIALGHCACIFSARARCARARCTTSCIKTSCWYLGCFWLYLCIFNNIGTYSRSTHAQEIRRNRHMTIKKFRGSQFRNFLKPCVYIPPYAPPSARYPTPRNI
jgi:hypothetical protein